MNMEIAGALAVMGLFFGGIFSVLIWIVWRRYRVLPAGSDLQAFQFRLTESIRSLGYRETTETGPVRRFRAPAWQQWTVGMQDISVEPAGDAAVSMTGPSFNVSLIGRGYAGAMKRPYTGRQPVWPLFRGFMRLSGSPWRIRRFCRSGRRPASWQRRMWWRRCSPRSAAAWRRGEAGRVFRR